MLYAQLVDELACVMGIIESAVAVMRIYIKPYSDCIPLTMIARVIPPTVFFCFSSFHLSHNSNSKRVI